MNQSEKIDLLAQALVKVQWSLTGARKESKSNYGSYADLESCWDAVREPLAKNGLCIVQTMSFHEQAGTCVDTLLIHSSGQWIKGSLPVRAKSPDPMAQASAITYSRRYSLAAICGLVQTDDDGRAAQDAETSNSRPAPGWVPHATQSNTIKAQVGHLVQQQASQAVMQCDCGGKLMVSKYNENELYCLKCKKKTPKMLLQGDDFSVGDDRDL